MPKYCKSQRKQIYDAISLCFFFSRSSFIHFQPTSRIQSLRCRTLTVQTQNNIMNGVNSEVEKQDEPVGQETAPLLSTSTPTTHALTSTNGTENPSTVGNAEVAATNINEQCSDEPGSKTSFRGIYWFCAVLALDLVSSVLLLSPTWTWIKKYGGETLDHYTLYGSSIDLAILALVRLLVCVVALLVSFCIANVKEDFYYLELNHPNGDKKSRDELEQEALEEPFLPWFYRYLFREAFLGEWVAVISQVFCIIKSLARMNMEMGTLRDAEPYHPVFWFGILFCAVLSLFEALNLDHVCKLCGEYGKQRQAPTLLRTLSSGLLTTPLLLDQDPVDVEGQPNTDDNNNNDGQDPVDDNEIRGTSDITGDCAFKAKWTDLLMMCWPDIHLICGAFAFLLMAAVAQVYIPRFLGNILDALAKAFSDKDSDDESRNLPMWAVPGFLENVKKLVLVSLLAGIFAGLRGSIFVSSTWRHIENVRMLHLNTLPYT